MRDSADISGLRDIRSHRSIGRHSLPRFKSSAYLELYMLGKERDRLEKELVLLERRRKVIDKRLSELRTEMESLERSAQSDRPDNGGEKATGWSVPAKKWKRFPLKY